MQHNQIEGTQQTRSSEERAAYIVIGHQFGAEFSSESLDAACGYVTEKLRAQAMETALINPSCYRIQRVKTG